MLRKIQFWNELLCYSLFGLSGRERGCEYIAGTESLGGGREAARSDWEGVRGRTCGAHVNN